MFKFDVTQFVPKFILRDKTGYAIAKAIEAGIQKMNDTAEEGLEVVNNVDAMPEWRLDELGWEYGILYDSLQPVDVKQKWVADALKNYRKYGTLSALREYLTAVFDTVRIQEASEYGGDPYHFKISVEGDYSMSNRDLIYKAIDTVGNVRSVCDGVTYGAVTADTVYAYAGAGTVGMSIDNYSELVE